MNTTIIFDWGGVLTRGRYTPMLYAELNRVGGLQSVSIEELDELVRSVETVPCPSERLIELIRERFDCAIEPAKLKQALRASIRMRHDVIDAIADLAQEHALVIASNNFDFVTDILRAEYAEFLAHFDHVFFSNELGVRKPDPRFYERIIEEMGVDASECLFVDDKEKNVEGARAAGMHAIVFTDMAALLDAVRNLH